jgi:hypothetical protein
MWDRSFRWQRLVRHTAGLLTLAAVVITALLLSTTQAAGRARAGLAEIARETAPDAASQLVCAVPAELKVTQGVLVYREGEHGKAEIVGRVIAVERRETGDDRVTILLTPAAAGAMAGGGKVRGAEPTLTVERAFRLLISPSIPREEAVIARDMIWPALEQHVLPGLKMRVTEEVTRSFEDLDPDDVELLDATLKDLRGELAPLEEQLLNRLANRAWQVVGVTGVAEGVVRKARDGAENTYKDVRDWVRSWWREDDGERDRAGRDFLTEERATALRLALEEEVETFIKENERELEGAFNRVLSRRRAEYVRAFETKWGPKLYERALVPAYLEGETGVLAAMESYANDFAARRLLTNEGGPRLLLAYALRTSLGITQDPLLVIAPDESGETSFEWIMPRLPGEQGSG